MAASDLRKILIGSHNPSKIQSLSELFAKFPEILPLSPKDLGVEVDTAETGYTMAENAELKALAFHRAAGLAVLSADSGLYFRELPMDDPRQPGAHVRRVNGKMLEDDEMIAYYGGLAKEFGVLHACYCNAYAAVNFQGELKVFFQDDPNDPDFFEAFGFLLCSEPHPKRNPGWPLDSLSMDPFFHKYYFDIPEEAYAVQELAQRKEKRIRFQKNLERFLQETFHLTAVQ